MKAQRRLASLQWMSLILGLWALVAIGFAALYLPEALAAGGRGSLGYDAAPAKLGRIVAHRLTTFEANSPLPAAGVAIGDLVVDPPRGRLREHELIVLKIAHEGQLRTVSMRAGPAVTSATGDADLIFETALGLFATVLGALLVVRRRRDEAALSLGSALFAAAAGLIALLPPVGALGAAIQLWYATCLPLFLLLLTLVAHFMASDSGRSDRLPARGRVALALVLMLWIVWIGPYLFGYAVPAEAFMLRHVQTAVQGFALLVCALAFYHTWRRVEAEQRERLRWLFVGFGAGLFGLALTIISGAVGLNADQALIVSICADLSATAALCVIAYAILRQRVMDVGFAINRAIVYGVLTGAMLIAVGIGEWLVDHVLEFEQRQESRLIDAALALGVFLFFHRFLHWVSHAVEKMLFRSWHTRSAALEHFLTMSEHYTDADALTTALLEALDTYTESVGSALYAEDTDGKFVLHRATLAEASRMFEPNDTVIVHLKADYGRALAISPSAKRHARAWLFPLARRSHLLGFVLLGAKRSRDVYRPDEIERVSRAVRQVGFDLHALRLEQGVNRAKAIAAC